MDNIITLYTDGACSGNPGPGGWACVLVWNGVERGLSGYNLNTTNNAMELQAVVEGLKLLKGKSNISITSDSKYIVDSLTKGWLENWIRKGEVREFNSTRPNGDTWWMLYNLLKMHNWQINWVKGHAGNKYNEMCDKMAVQQRDIAINIVRDTMW